MQLFARPSHTNIAKSPLFLELTRARFVHPCMRENPLLHTDHEYDREFETLGSMKCHKRHFLFHLGRICARHQGHLFEEFR
ncbi:hypothetical protein D9M68_831820 [compost metagenome]